MNWVKLEIGKGAIWINIEHIVAVVDNKDGELYIFLSTDVDNKPFIRADGEEKSYILDKLKGRLV